MHEDTRLGDKRELVLTCSDLCRGSGLLSVYTRFWLFDAFGSRFEAWIRTSLLSHTFEICRRTTVGSD